MKQQRIRKIRVEVGGIVGEGLTKAEAREDAEYKISLALSGSYTPLIISAHGKSALIWREPDGWTYRLIYADQAEEQDGMLLHGWGGCRDSRDEVERMARQHLAQALFDFENVTGLGVIRDAENWRQHLDWCAWQHCYRAWVQVGCTDPQAHGNACHREWPEGVEPWVAPDGLVCPVDGTGEAYRG